MVASFVGKIFMLSVSTFNYEKTTNILPPWKLPAIQYTPRGLDIAWNWVFYEIYRHEHEGEAPRASCHVHVYCIKHEDFSCYNYNVFYITTTPYLPCNNNNNINRKELYDFYYTAITLTTGYKYREWGVVAGLTLAMICRPLLSRVLARP